MAPQLFHFLLLNFNVQVSFCEASSQIRARLTHLDVAFQAFPVNPIQPYYITCVKSPESADVAFCHGSMRAAHSAAGYLGESLRLVGAS